MGVFIVNTDWLLENADTPIKYILTENNLYLEQLKDNFEVQHWLSQLRPRSENKELGKIHGSHDYRMENILGKCCILGLSKTIQWFSKHITFILNFLNKQINEQNREKLSFEKLYSYRDYETVLACFLPMLGFGDDIAVKYITKKRIDILYNFTIQNRYDIYVDGSSLKGVKKEWQSYVIDPDLYADGNIALPSMHDFILFAGMYNHLDADDQNKIETIVKWIFDDRYMSIIRRYGYFYVPGGSYSIKAIIFKMHLESIENLVCGGGDLGGLIFTYYVLSYFKSAKNSDWFRFAGIYLDSYKTENNRYIFPRDMITEKTDNYVVNGGHMNIGENVKSKNYAEIISTCWMEKIQNNL